jgi:hypothetical protein
MNAGSQETRITNGVEPSPTRESSISTQFGSESEIEIEYGTPTSSPSGAAKLAGASTQLSLITVPSPSLTT